MDGLLRFNPAIMSGSPASGKLIKSLAPIAWFRFGQGITVATGVSQWDDQSGNANHLKQSSGTAQPAKQADGSILFDGSNDYLKCTAFTLIQPETVYLLGRQVTWSSNGYLFDGNTVNTGGITQAVSTPNIRIVAGSGVADNTNLAVNTYAAVCAVFNGASSILRVNNTTETTGNAGAGNMGGFTLGAAANLLAFGNLQAKEVIIFPSAHDSVTRAKVIRYLMTVGGL